MVSLDLRILHPSERHLEEWLEIASAEIRCYWRLVKHDEEVACSALASPPIEWSCTRLKHHDGPHVAMAGEEHLHIWTEDRSVDLDLTEGRFGYLSKPSIIRTII